MSLGSSKAKKPKMSFLDAKLIAPSTRDRSDKQESKAALDYGGKKKPGSGSSAYSKGDVVIKSADILLECKTTMKASYRIEAETLSKITREALGEGKDPALEVEILGGTDPACEARWVMVPSSVFKRWLDSTESITKD
jgi:hypothetical protein